MKMPVSITNPSSGSMSSSRAIPSKVSSQRSPPSYRGGFSFFAARLDRAAPDRAAPDPDPEISSMVIFVIKLLSK